MALEVAAGAARGDDGLRAVGGVIAEGFAAWATDRIAAPTEQGRQRLGARLIATVEGFWC